MVCVRGVELIMVSVLFVQVDGAQTLTATCPGDVMKIFAKGNVDLLHRRLLKACANPTLLVWSLVSFVGSARRTTASTQMNAESSRSHLICSLVVRLKNKRSGKESLGKLTLVDLAGSEVRLLDCLVACITCLHGLI